MNAAERLVKICKCDTVHDTRAEMMFDGVNLVSDPTIPLGWLDCFTTWKRPQGGSSHKSPVPEFHVELSKGIHPDFGYSVPFVTKILMSPYDFLRVKSLLKRDKKLKTVGYCVLT